MSLAGTHRLDILPFCLFCRHGGQLGAVDPEIEHEYTGASNTI